MMRVINSKGGGWYVFFAIFFNESLFFGGVLFDFSSLTEAIGRDGKAQAISCVSKLH